MENIGPQRATPKSLSAIKAEVKQHQSILSGFIVQSGVRGNSSPEIGVRLPVNPLGTSIMT
jgi:hypothetical protein